MNRSKFVDEQGVNGGYRARVYAQKNGDEKLERLVVVVCLHARQWRCGGRILLPEKEREGRWVCVGWEG